MVPIGRGKILLEDEGNFQTSTEVLLLNYDRFGSITFNVYFLTFCSHLVIATSILEFKNQFQPKLILKYKKKSVEQRSYFCQVFVHCTKPLIGYWLRIKWFWVLSCTLGAGETFRYHNTKPFHLIVTDWSRWNPSFYNKNAKNQYTGGICCDRSVGIWCLNQLLSLSLIY